MVTFKLPRINSFFTVIDLEVLGLEPAKVSSHLAGSYLYTKMASKAHNPRNIHP